MKKKTKRTNGGNKANNAQKWDEALIKYAPLIYAKLRNWNCPSLGVEADDILQEIRIRIWKAMEQGEQIRCFPAYLRKVTDSVIISYFRKIRNTIEYRDKRIPIRYVEDNTNDNNGDLTKMDRLIYERLPRILESRQKVLSLYLSGFTFKEIAELTKYTITKTRVLYFRAVRDMKKQIQRIEP
jgi:RNA polymerase sigma factor (sigma-70 family)